MPDRFDFRFTSLDQVFLGQGICIIQVQCSAVQCSAVQCSAVQCSAVQCSAVFISPGDIAVTPSLMGGLTICIGHTALHTAGVIRKAVVHVVLV